MSLLQPSLETEVCCKYKHCSVLKCWSTCSMQIVFWKAHLLCLQHHRETGKCTTSAISVAQLPEWWLQCVQYKCICVFVYTQIQIQENAPGVQFEWPSNFQRPSWLSDDWNLGNRALPRGNSFSLVPCWLLTEDNICLVRKYEKNFCLVRYIHSTKRFFAIVWKEVPVHSILQWREASVGRFPLSKLSLPSPYNHYRHHRWLKLSSAGLHLWATSGLSGCQSKCCFAWQARRSSSRTASPYISLLILISHHHTHHHYTSKKLSSWKFQLNIFLILCCYPTHAFKSVLSLFLQSLQQPGQVFVHFRIVWKEKVGI